MLFVVPKVVGIWKLWISILYKIDQVSDLLLKIFVQQLHSLVGTTNNNLKNVQYKAELAEKVPNNYIL